ncbi:MAG: type III pantothenate kinase [Clostridia bacterium]
MLITVDIGNSNINISAFTLDEEVDFSTKKPFIKFGLSSLDTKTADEYSLIIHNLFYINNLDVKNIKSVIIACVVPRLNATLYDAFKKISPAFIYNISAGIKTGIKVEPSSEVGADIIANAVAVSNIYPLPCAIINFGTATTITLVDKNKSLKGVVIMPGFLLSLNSLASGTALLNHVSTKNLKSPLIGKTSEESIKSGVLRSFSFTTDGFLNKIKEEYNFNELTAVATGDWSEFIIPNCQNKIIDNEDLTALGLLKLYYLNKRN